MGGFYRAALGFTGNAPRPGAPDGSGHRSLEAGSALPSVPGSALPVRPLKGAGFFFTGSCGACHATLALPHPFGVRTDSCPGRSALHRVSGCPPVRVQSSRLGYSRIQPFLRPRSSLKNRHFNINCRI